MKILVTGAKGFIGKNLCLSLKSAHFKDELPRAREEIDVFECDLDTPREMLDGWLEKCDFVFHLAGVNRPQEASEFKTGNVDFTQDLLNKLERRKGKFCRNVAVPVVLASSTQAELDSDYGRSKKAAEEAVFAYGEKTGAPIYVYRFANVFGKWCRPNYNSAVATWCYNIARGLPIMVRDPSATVTLIYIDDLVNTLIKKLCVAPTQNKLMCLSIEPSYTKTLGEITELIRTFHDEPRTLLVPNQSEGFVKKLYATYLSYLPDDKFGYPLNMHCDSRGSFTEILRTEAHGQVSVNISRPGVIKGQHWHHTKHEKFCVVSGRGLIQFRKMSSQSKILNYRVSGDKIEVVRIPPGYTHNIINEGDVDMVTLMWASEVFDSSCPDTYREEV